MLCYVIDHKRVDRNDSLQNKTKTLYFKFNPIISTDWSWIFLYTHCFAPKCLPFFSLKKSSQAMFAGSNKFSRSGLVHLKIEFSLRGVYQAK